MGLFEEVQEAAEAVRKKIRASPQVGIILGSGLGDFADRAQDAVAVAYSDIPHFPPSSVTGHKGRLVCGRVNGVVVACLQGRVHLYEGVPAWKAAFPARVLCALRVKTLVTTNAAGAIRADLRPGDLMRITDHINLTGQNPLVGPNDDRLGPRFPDLSRAYDPDPGQKLEAAGARVKVSLKRGVYAQLDGPSYETPAEVRFLRSIGADAVGMSTIPEVIAAAHMGVRAAGVSCITNLAAGIADGPLSHDEVAEIAGRVRDRFAALLEAFLPDAAA